MYPKTIIEKIIESQAKGASAEETRRYLKEEIGKAPCLNTIYKHRRSPVGLELLYELIRQQERDILKASSEEEREVAMRYRDKLIEKLMDKLFPERFESYSYSKEEKKVDVNVEGLLAQYEDLFEEATILENAAPEPIHPTSPNRKASAVPST